MSRDGTVSAQSMDMRNAKLWLGESVAKSPTKGATEDSTPRGHQMGGLRMIYRSDTQNIEGTLANVTGALRSVLDELVSGIYPTIDRLERCYIQFVLEKTGGRKDKAAKILGINRRTLYRKEREYDLGKRDPGISEPPSANNTGQSESQMSSGEGEVES